MNQETHPRPATLREPEAAKYLSVSVATLRRARMVGRTRSGITGPAFVRIPGGRTIVYRLADLDAWLESNVHRAGGAA